VPRELDMARAAVESLVRQVATLNRAQQAAAADAARAAAAAQQRSDEAAAAAAALRADTDALRAGLAEAREGAAREAEELRRRLEQQLAAHRAAVDDALQVGHSCEENGEIGQGIARRVPGTAPAPWCRGWGVRGRMHGAFQVCGGAAHCSL
jgi:ABC-type transporter Mla subunit MlaD